MKQKTTKDLYNDFSVQRSVDEIIKEREERAARRKAAREKKE